METFTELNLNPSLMQSITRRAYEDNPDSTFTPLPRNITPLGIELDPTTGTDLSTNDKK